MLQDNQNASSYRSRKVNNNDMWFFGPSEIDNYNRYNRYIMLMILR